ncbi:FAR1-related protein [Trifolium medium]|uniref:FAR1-related protein n=1 Tax=Trifolium medium TaxID=97028 RepID=A0A392NRL6_9FABA|nr:FAR1-related protein [Trifolium medium]
MIRELNLNRPVYLKLYGSEERQTYITGTVLRQGKNGSQPSSRIVCLGLLPGHFVHVKLKDGCPIPPTCPQWRKHCSEESVAWESSFLDRQKMFDELVENERGNIIDIGVGCNRDHPIEL